MIVWFKIALRNLVKNRRRSIITILAISFGFAGMNLFSGFIEYMYSANRETAIFMKSRGHLKIFKKGFLQKKKLDSEPSLLNSEEIKIIEQICRGIPDVILITPQLRISGLVSNGRVSTIFIAQGIVPSSEDILLSRMTMVEMEKIQGRFEGRKLQDDKMHGVAMSRSLAKLLELKVGSNGVVFSNTINGQMNALDFEIFQVFDSEFERTNDMFMRVPLSFAQALYDWDGAEGVTLLLNSSENMESIRNQLQTVFSQRGMDFEIKTWEELGEWYRNVKEMFDTIFIFLFIIVLIIVVMSVANTMSMVVFERTREIGMLRALGLKRKGVKLLFGLESSLLGVWGSLLGLGLTILGWWLVNFSKLTWIPPGFNSHVPVAIYFVPNTMVYIFFYLLILCLIASLIPARHASRQNVVDALGHV